jgi:hypothetical protein
LQDRHDDDASQQKKVFREGERETGEDSKIIDIREYTPKRIPQLCYLT